MEKVLISKEAWVIRLMQGMIGDYGNPDNSSECYYHNGHFIHAYDDDRFYLNLNDVNPVNNFWITDEKGIPSEPLSVINIKETS